MSERLGLATWPARQRAREELMADLRGGLGDVPFDAAWHEGARMSVEVAIAYASEAAPPE